MRSAFTHLDEHEPEASTPVRVRKGGSGRAIVALPGARLSIFGCASALVLAMSFPPGDHLDEKATHKHEIAVLRAAGGSIRCLAFSPDGGTLATIGWDQTALVWDVHSRRLLAPLETRPHPANCIAFSPDGRLLAMGNTDGTVTFLETGSYREAQTLKVGSKGASSLVFSPGGKLLAVGLVDGSIAIVDHDSGQTRATIGHKGAITSLAFSPDGRILASASSDRTVKLWEPTCGLVLSTFSKGVSDIVSLSFSPDGKSLAGAVSTSGEVKLWDVATVREPRSLRSPDRLATSLAFTPNSRTLIAGYGSTDSTQQGAGMIQYWDAETCEQRTALEQHTPAMTCLGLSPDGALLAMGGPDGTVRIWETPDGVSLR